jgi:hypothetical protein
MLEVEYLDEDESRDRAGGEPADDTEDSLSYLG